ncbi:Autophagy protein 7, partial [Blyttiomyces sp. JEL0837]
RTISTGAIQIAKLAEWHSFFDGVPESERIVGFADPSSLPTNPGWPLRNFLLLLKKHFEVSSITVVCYREFTGKKDATPSIMINVELPGVVGDELPKFVGWEKNSAGKLGPRLADLAPLMDPKRLAETAVDLNLKLMRWRIMPDLQLEKVAGTKCLLLGAGTLGCYVARALMAWGVRTVTFVDNGTVSFSNPVRQPLYNYEDSLGGGKPKAIAAAEALKKIFPGINSEGHNISIPMPGHPSSNHDATKQDIDLLRSLIASHDAIFLLTDSREARWLPTLIGAFLGKIVINSALGFDTFVVMRHGMRVGSAPEGSSEESHGGTLGCYYCNDVVAPADSLSDRTLDQQCTVTRPGLSLLASGQAVELLVSLLNHPDGPWAPADQTTPPSESTKQPLGLVPHQIRGYLTHFSNLLVAGRTYDKCTACSKIVLDEYRKNGSDFILKVLESPKYLEEITGLTELHKDTEDAEVDWAEEDDDM